MLNVKNKIIKEHIAPKKQMIHLQRAWGYNIDVSSAGKAPYFKLVTSHNHSKTREVGRRHTRY